MFRRRARRRSSKESNPNALPALVLAATDEMRLSLDWGRVMEVYERANSIQDDDELAEGVRILRKRIQDQQHRVVMYGLAVAESLVKNCSNNFAVLKHVASTKFMKSMVKLVTRGQSKGGRDNLEAMEKALALIQSWGEAYLSHQDQGVRLFVSTYHQLRIKGLHFPAPIGDNAPIFTPAARPAAEASEAKQQSTAASNFKIPAELLRDYTYADQTHTMIDGTANVIIDSLMHVESKEELLTNEVVTDLMAQIQQLHPRIMSDLESALMVDPPPAILGDLLHINDKLHAMLRLHAHILEHGVISQEPSIDEYVAASDTGASHSRSDVASGGSGDGGGSDSNNGNDGDDLLSMFASDDQDQSGTVHATPPSKPVIGKLSSNLNTGSHRRRRRGGSGSSPALVAQAAADSSNTMDLLTLGVSSESKQATPVASPSQAAPAATRVADTGSNDFDLLTRQNSDWDDFSNAGGATLSPTPPAAAAAPVIAPPTAPAPVQKPKPALTPQALAALYSSNAHGQRPTGTMGTGGMGLASGPPMVPQMVQPRVAPQTMTSAGVPRPFAPQMPAPATNPFEMSGNMVQSPGNGWPSLQNQQQQGASGAAQGGGNPAQDRSSNPFDMF